MTTKWHKLIVAGGLRARLAKWAIQWWRSPAHLPLEVDSMPRKDPKTGRFVFGKELTLEERFWPKVDIRGFDDCWEWIASKIPAGYGQIHNNGTMLRAHRVAWELMRGPIPKGLCLLHHCDNRACVNPNHLFLGTKADNMADMEAKGRRRSAPPRGVNSPNAKLTNEKVRAIRLSTLPQRVLAKMHGVHQSTIWTVKHRKSWSWLAY